MLHVSLAVADFAHCENADLHDRLEIEAHAIP